MILHLFKKDLRHSRVLLSVWIMLVLLQCALIGSSVRPGDRALQIIYASLSFLIPSFQFLMLIVIVPHFLHEEPLVGTTGFWFTRPISRSALLKAKALFGAMLVGLPLLAEIGVLAANGVAWHDIGLAVPEIIINQLSVLLIIAVLAALTDSFGRFAIAGVILIVVWLLTTLAIFSLRTVMHPEAVMAMAGGFALVRSRALAGSLLIVVGGGAVVAYQYLTRKTARSIAVAGIIAICVMAINVFWPWNFLAGPPVGVSRADFDPAAVKVSLGRTMSQDVSTIRGIGLPPKKLTAVVDVQGLPAGYVATPKVIAPRLSLPGGRRIRLQNAIQSPFNAHPDVGALESALGGIPVVNSEFSSSNFTPLFTVAADVYSRNADRPLRFSADIDLVVSKYLVVAEMRLARGSRYDHGSERAIITDVLHQGDDVDVVMQDRNVQLLFDRNRNPVDPAVFFRLDRVDTVYLLQNKKRNEAVLQKTKFNFDFDAMAAVSGRRLVQRTLELSFGPEPNRLTPDLTEAWLADAKLVRLQLVPVAEFSKSIAVENFRIVGQNYFPPPWSSATSIPESFAYIVLPQNATKAQIMEYIDSILAASQNRNSYLKTDPQIGMLCRVGSQNLDVLIAAESGKSFGLVRYLDSTVLRLARPEDKKLILRALPEHTGLVDVVVKYGWQAEVHDILIAGLKDESQRALPRSWIEAVSSFQEPGTYPDLKAYLLRSLRKNETFQIIRTLPGIDLQDTVEAVWKKSKYGMPFQIIDACPMAAEFGHLDAVAAVVDLLKQRDISPAGQRRAAFIIKRFTAAVGDNDAIVAWFESNRDRLVFDAAKKRFLLPPSPPAE